MNGQGHLVPLKTIYELQIKETLVEAYVVEIPIQLASKALSILRPVLPKTAGAFTSYLFLRRFVTSPHLPPGLRDSVRLQDGPATIHLLIPPPLPLDPEGIIAALRPHVQVESLPIVRTAHIPIDPPTNAEQAALWSQDYWPCTFNPASQTIQKAPPLRVLRTTQAELEKPAQLKSYFNLAQRAAGECVVRALGREFAAVIVDPVTEEVIAVAGDARWFELPGEPRSSKSHQHELAEGRPERHALMRAIAIVADKEQQRKNSSCSSSTNVPLNHSTNLDGRALTPTEKFYAAPTTETTPPPSHHHHQPPEWPAPQSAPRPDAYLCHGLDIYLTHEPCIACSMAMIHSRFRACVLSRRMPTTGALCAERGRGDGDGNGVGNGYGLFWRKELNWRVLAFHYRDKSEGDGQRLGGGGDDDEDASLNA